MTDFSIDAEREVDYVLLDQLRALAAKVTEENENENEQLRREVSDGRRDDPNSD